MWLEAHPIYAVGCSAHTGLGGINPRQPWLGVHTLEKALGHATQQLGYWVDTSFDVPGPEGPVYHVA